MPHRPRKLGPRVTVSVTPGDYNTLNDLADREHASISWVIRRAIDEYIGRAASGRTTKLNGTAQKVATAPGRRA